MVVVQIKTTVGTVFKNPNASILVIDGKKVKKIRARNIEPAMKLIFYKDVLAELTVDDVHHDLMSSTSEGARRYQESHRTLHQICTCSMYPETHETTLLRYRFFEDFYQSPFAPESLNKLTKVQYHRHLFKISGRDFEKDVYDGIIYYLFERMDITLVPVSKQLLKNWLNGSTFLPRKANALRIIGHILMEDEIENMAFNRWDQDRNEVNPQGLREVALYYRGRRSALMSYVAKMKGVGKSTKTGKSTWKKEGIESMVDEIEIVLENHIDEISGQLISTRVYDKNEIETSQSADTLMYEGKREKELKLSKRIITPSAERPDDLKSEVASLGFHTEGMVFDTWEDERRRKTDREEELEEEERLRKKKEKRQKKKLMIDKLNENLVKWTTAQIKLIPIMQELYDEVDNTQESILPESIPDYRNNVEIWKNAIKAVPRQVFEFIIIHGYDDGLFNMSLAVKNTAYIWAVLRGKKWRLKDDMTVYENADLTPHPIYIELREMYNTSDFLRMRFGRFHEWVKFMMFPSFIKRKSNMKGISERFKREGWAPDKVTETLNRFLSALAKVERITYYKFKRLDGENNGGKCGEYAKRIPPIFWYSNAVKFHDFSKRQKELMTKAVHYDHGYDFNYASYDIYDNEDGETSTITLGDGIGITKGKKRRRPI